MARRLASLHDLAVTDPPLAIPGFTCTLVWHRRADEEPEHKWLRMELVAAAHRADKALADGHGG